jgi:predicted nucleic acid-binding Zn ribbon protein
VTDYLFADVERRESAPEVGSQKGCLVCGREVGKLKTFCSYACRMQRRYERRRLARRACGLVDAYSSEAQRRRSLRLGPETATCPTCGGLFIRRRLGHTYCSRLCAYRNKEWSMKCGPKPKPPGPCKRCGTNVEKPRWVYCRECREVASRESSRRYYQKRHPGLPSRHCAWCGATFSPGSSKKKRHCSSLCGRRAGKAARRAREHGGEVGEVSAIEVFIRDGWRCHLCGRKVLPALRGTAALNAPTLDHVVPLGGGHGGAHTMRNLRCACRECNGKKSAHPLGQPALF